MPVTIKHAMAANKVSNLPMVLDSKRMFVKSYGCQMNVYDGLRMMELMEPLGYVLQDTAENADLILLNTCHIREKADDKVFSDIGRIRRIAAENAIIAVGGCTGQALGAKVMEQAKVVSIVFGPQTYHRLPEFIEKVEAGRRARKLGNKNAPIRVTDTEIPALEKFDNLPKPKVYSASAFVTIQEGCDKFCSYCVVPYTRGAEVSRSVESIVQECEGLVEQGVREITLLGQNVNAYHGELNGKPVTLAKLLEILAEIPDLLRLRFTTSHPKNTGDDLITAFRDNPKLMPYFHLPVQSGSDKILHAMNRSHTAEEYLEVLDSVRMARPDIAISGDFIAGFAGETEEDFAQTLDMVREVGYATAYSFMYSERPNTPGALLDDQVPLAVKKERIHKLQEVIAESQLNFNKKFIGKTVEVLVEEKGKLAGQLRGRSPHNVSVNFVAADSEVRGLIGTLVKVKVTEALPKSLVGRLIFE